MTANNKLLRILLLEDNPNDVDMAKLQLRKLRSKFTLVHVETRVEFEQQVNAFCPDIILADNSLPGYSGEAALEYVQLVAPQIPFVFVSGTMGEEVAIEALQQGAVDYVLKQRLGRLVPAVERAVQEAAERAATRRAQSELWRTQNLLQSLIDHSPALISVQNLEGRLILTNDPFRNRFGIAAEADAELTLGSVIPAPSRVAIREHDVAVSKQKMPVVREHTISFPDGDKTYLSVRFPLQDRDGAVEAICSIDMDISDRKRTEEYLLQQANVLDQASDAIFTSNTHGDLTYCNEAAVQKSGWSQEGILGRKISDIFPGFSASLLAKIRQTALSHGVWRGEVKACNRQDKPVWMDVGVTRIFNAGSSAPVFVMICTDISEKKELAEQFLHVQRLENLGMLAAGIAHDMNNVLSPIGMVATLLRSRLSEDRDRRFLDILEQSSSRGAGLVRQILSFAQGVSGDLREVQVKHILRDVLAMIQETFPKNITLDEFVPRDLWVVEGDATQIHQIILNLCVNARDAMEEGGTLGVKGENVTLTARDCEKMPQADLGDWLKIEVSDTGSGIPAEITEQIWSPFFSTKVASKGTGLGLSTVRGIVERHGGFVHLESTLDVGSIFQVYIPAAGARQASASPFDQGGARFGAGEHILVVDDEALILDIAQEALTEHGYRVSTARDGGKASEILMSDGADVDLLLTDLLMPVLGGAELISMLKSLHSDARVIVMTGLDLKEVRADPKVAAYINKPFEIGDLLSAVGEVLGPVTPALP